MKLVEYQGVTGTLENSGLADIFPTGSMSTEGKVELLLCFPNGLTCKSHNKNQSQYGTGSTILSHVRIRDPDVTAYITVKTAMIHRVLPHNF